MAIFQQSAETEIQCPHDQWPSAVCGVDRPFPVVSVPMRGSVEGPKDSRIFGMAGLLNYCRNALLDGRCRLIDGPSHFLDLGQPFAASGCRGRTITRVVSVLANSGGTCFERRWFR